MGFSDSQVRALSRSVPARSIRSRASASGKQLTYIEGWYALAQANRIFGFDGWDRETVETRCLQAREARGNFAAIYSARVRLTVRAEDAVIVRDGHGTGEAYGTSVGEVHDRALKAAETDATKRALATFGKAFGLALYAGDRQARPKRNPERQMNGAAAVVDGRALPSADRHRHPVASPVPDTAADHPGGAAANRDRQLVSEQATPNGPAIRQPIEKSALALSEPRRVRDKDHLRFVASQPCLLCSATPSDAHHLRFAQPRAMARKVGDDFTVPLCRRHHRDLHHSGNEGAWWHDMGIDPLDIAKQLWEESEARRTRKTPKTVAL